MEWYEKAEEHSSAYASDLSLAQRRCSRITDVWDEPRKHFLTLGHGTRWVWSAGAGLSTGVFTGVGGSIHIPYLFVGDAYLLLRNTRRLPTDPASGIGGRALVGIPFITTPSGPWSLGPAIQTQGWSSETGGMNGYAAGARLDYRPVLDSYTKGRVMGRGFYVTLFIPVVQSDWAYSYTSLSLGFNWGMNKDDVWFF